MKLQKNYSQIIDLTIILALIITLGLIFLIFQDLVITNPISPWHDELWNLYASTEFFNHTQNLWPGCNQGMCFNIMGYKFPVLSGSYHGIIKSFLFLPIVMVYKIELIRIANIVLYFSPLFYILKQKKYFGKIGCELIAVSYFFLFIPLTFEAVFDQGQFIISKIFFLIASVELVKELHDHNPKRIFLIILMASLGTYEKLTNLPITISIYIVIGLILLTKDKTTITKILKYSWLIPILFIPYIVYFFHDFSFKNFERLNNLAQSQHSNYVSNLFIVYKNAFEFLFKENFTLSSFFDEKISTTFPIASFLIITLVFLLSIAESFKEKNKSQILIVLLPFLSLLIFPAFDGLYRPWHFFAFSSLLIIPVAYLCFTNIHNHNSLKKNLTLAIICLSIADLNIIFNKTYEKERRSPYSQELLKTAIDVKKQPISNIVCLDYSVCYNLIMATDKKYKLLAEYSFSNKNDMCKNIENLKGFDYLLITHNFPKNTSWYGQNADLFYGRSSYFNEACSINLLRLEKLEQRFNNEYSIYSHKIIK